MIFQHCSATCGLSALLRNVWSFSTTPQRVVFSSTAPQRVVFQRVFCLFVCFCFLTILSYAWSFNPWVWSDTSGNMWSFSHRQHFTVPLVWSFSHRQHFTMCGLSVTGNTSQCVAFRQQHSTSVVFRQQHCTTCGLSAATLHNAWSFGSNTAQRVALRQQHCTMYGLSAATLHNAWPSGSNTAQCMVFRQQHCTVCGHSFSNVPSPASVASSSDVYAAGAANLLPSVCS